MSDDFLTGSIFDKLIRFSVPIALSGILQLLFSMADTVIVGRFCGDRALAAVGSNGALLGMFTNLFLGLSAGCSIVVSGRIARREAEGVRRAVHTAIALALLGGCFLAAAGNLSADMVLEWMQYAAEVRGLAERYLRICFLGMPAMLTYNFGAAMMRAEGNSRQPFFYLALSGLVNVILNIVLIVGFHMGVPGAAAATVVSQSLSAVLVMNALERTRGMLHFSWKNICIFPEELLEIVRTGVPIGLQSIMFSLADSFIQASVNTFGAVVMAGNAAALNLLGFPGIFFTAINQSSLVMVRQNVSTGRNQRARRILIYSGTCIIVLHAGIVFLSARCSGMLLGLYCRSPEAVHAGLRRLQIAVPFFGLYALNGLAADAQRSMGYNVLPTVTAFFGICVLRIVWVMMVFRIPEFNCPETIYLAYPLSWIFTFTASMVCLTIVWHRKTGRSIWKRNV